MSEESVRGDLEWGTIPRLVRAAAENHGDQGSSFGRREILKTSIVRISDLEDSAE